MEVYQKYRMMVINYFYSEWYDSCINLKKLKTKTELDKLIYSCYKENVNVPNAAKEIEIFLQTLYEQL